jgi:hypothetical protein
MSKKVELDSGLFKAAVWSGIALIVAMVIAQGLLMHFIPPPSPALSAEELAQRFIDRRDEIRLGCLIQCIFWSFCRSSPTHRLPWSAAGTSSSS